MVSGLLQPQALDCWKPKTAKAMPTATRAAPTQSMLSSLRFTGIFASNVSTTARMATGTLTQKIARQSYSVRYPPAIGPTAVKAPVKPKKSASAFPRSEIGKTATTSANAAGNMIAPPKPCNTRKAMIQLCDSEPTGVKPHIAEATANMTVPTTTMRLWPTMSDSRPPKRKNAERASR